MQQMRAYATTTYSPAATTFLSTSSAPEALLGPLQGFTGMQASLWRSRFNMGPTFFRNNLKGGVQYGRYDSRVTGAPGPQGNDPSSYLISPSFDARIVEYLSNELLYTTPSSYVSLSDAVMFWDFRHGNLPVPDSIPDLGAALAMNPRLKVMLMSGYHDIATPFFNSERDVARLASPNVTVRNYLGGHMTYLTDASRAQQKADLAAWYRSTP
jgi:carboxypeptidase C (cathepsin A)